MQCADSVSASDTRNSKEASMNDQNKTSQIHNDACGTNLGGAVDRALPGAVHDGFIWLPANGNDHFYGEVGQDTLYLPTLDATRLRALLTLYDASLAMHINLQGRAQFFDQGGLQHSSGGELRIGGAKLIFFGLRAIQLG